jgi:thioredoxin-related protein
VKIFRTLLAGALLASLVFGFGHTLVPAQAHEKIYDPARNSADDLKAATATATAEHKRILLVVGGNWCGWCFILDDFWHDHKDLSTLVAANYVVVHINMSRENENKAFLASYPKISGYPHIFVLESDGKLLHSQDTSPLEDGHSYNKGRMKDFLEKWVPGKAAA